MYYPIYLLLLILYSTEINSKKNPTYKLNEWAPWADCQTKNVLRCGRQETFLLKGEKYCARYKVQRQMRSAVMSDNPKLKNSTEVRKCVGAWATRSCMFGWEYFEGTDKWYYFSTDEESTDWWGAVHRCVQHQSMLYTIESEEEFKWIRNTLDEFGLYPTYWSIGAMRFHGSSTNKTLLGEWRNIDGFRTRNKTHPYILPQPGWVPGEPSRNMSKNWDQSESLTYYHSDYEDRQRNGKISGFMDDPFNKTRNFICKKKCWLPYHEEMPEDSWKHGYSMDYFRG